MPNKQLAKEWTCKTCRKVIPQGTYLEELVWVLKTKSWYHPTCVIIYPDGTVAERESGKVISSPPAASSERQEGPKEARSGASESPGGISTPSGVPPAAPEDPWVEIGAWVHASKVDLMLKAIKEART